MRGSVSEVFSTANKRPDASYRQGRAPGLTIRRRDPRAFRLQVQAEVAL